MEPEIDHPRVDSRQALARCGIHRPQEPRRSGHARRRKEAARGVLVGARANSEPRRTSHASNGHRLLPAARDRRHRGRFHPRPPRSERGKVLLRDRFHRRPVPRDPSGAGIPRRAADAGGARADRSGRLARRPARARPAARRRAVRAVARASGRNAPRVATPAGARFRLGEGDPHGRNGRRGVGAHRQAAEGRPLRLAAREPRGAPEPSGELAGRGRLGRAARQRARSAPPHHRRAGSAPSTSRPRCSPWRRTRTDSR